MLTGLVERSYRARQSLDGVSAELRFRSKLKRPADLPHADL